MHLEEREKEAFCQILKDLKQNRPSEICPFYYRHHDELDVLNAWGSERRTIKIRKLCIRDCGSIVPDMDRNDRNCPCTMVTMTKYKTTTDQLIKNVEDVLIENGVKQEEL